MVSAVAMKCLSGSLCLLSPLLLQQQIRHELTHICWIHGTVPLIASCSVIKLVGSELPWARIVFSPVRKHADFLPSISLFARIHCQCQFIKALKLDCGPFDSFPLPFSSDRHSESRDL